MSQTTPPRYRGIRQCSQSAANGSVALEAPRTLKLGRPQHPDITDKSHNGVIGVIVSHQEIQNPAGNRFVTQNLDADVGVVWPRGVPDTMRALAACITDGITTGT